MTHYAKLIDGSTRYFSTIGSDMMFNCTVGQNVTLDKLCDGNSDCDSGDDETNPLCESISYSFILFHIY